MTEHESLNRRELLLSAAALSGAAALGVTLTPRVARAESSAVEHPKLPWEPNALEPVISARTIEFHHGKHHKAYVENVLKAVKDTSLAGQPLEKVVAAAFEEAPKDASKQGLFNNAAQAWNHAFYWKSLKPGAAAPSGKLKEKIDADFGSVEKCLAELNGACMGQFGSGWAWLVLDGGKLKVEKTSNADLPLVHGRRPLLTIDVWEHAYYLDHQNKRADYVKGVLEKLLNWEFAAANLGA